MKKEDLVKRKDAKVAKKKVLIGLSWPYANGRLHIGHIASSLPADALARFHRMIGNEVSFVTGSDCYGTPILVRAIAEGTTPELLAEKYHAFHSKDFKALGFTFDNYDKTLSERHHTFVRDFHTQMYKGGYIYEKSASQLYCEKCTQFLPDRYVEGTCPFCKKDAKGDSCDSCGKILEPEDLEAPRCVLCNNAPIAREQTQLYLKLSSLQDKIQQFFDERKDNWTNNAAGMTQRYLTEGLRDRAITRSIDWGIPVPRDGWEDRRIYIWAENVLGYLSASEPKFIEDKNALHYYVHAKDNIPFHSIILPALIMAHGERYHLPDIIAASEYVTIGGSKISKSKGTQIYAHTLYEQFDVDMVRYYFLRTVSDKRDSNFTYEEFVNLVNGELVNNFGNLVNRTLSFIKTKFDNKIPKKSTERGIQEDYIDYMMQGNVNRALNCVMELVNFGNKYFAEKKPWETNDKTVIAEIIDIIQCATKMLKPFIPFACAKVQKWLASKTLPEIEILFKRLDIKEVLQ